jgi:Flp pilus assembly protein TadG
MDREYFLKNCQGTTSVEFAIVCLLLITLVFGIIEFGLLLYNKQIITNASREGARAGIVVRPIRLSNSDIEAVVKNYCEQHLVTFGASGTPVVNILPEFEGDPDDFDKNTSRCTNFKIVKSDGSEVRCELKVELDYSYDFLFLAQLGIGPTNLKSVANMRME